MRKTGVFLSTLLITIIIAVAFGILHDEITYTISPEYFTRFKLHQFHVGEAVPYRLGAAIVGFRATWWMGLMIGLTSGIICSLFPDPETMRKHIYKGIGLVFITTISISFLGFLYGKFYLGCHPPAWYYLPGNLTDQCNFIVAGTIHNASYSGGVIGLILSVIYYTKQLIAHRPSFKKR